MDRTEAFNLLEEHAKSNILVRHGLAVEACMRAYSTKFDGDEELWGIAGLLHDFDWDVCPTVEDHPHFGADILRQRGYSEEIIRAVLSHGNHTGIARESILEKTLYAVDELSGFIIAIALVKPNKSLSDVDVAGVKKKMKNKGFARSVNRDDIIEGALDLNVDLEDHIQFVIEALKSEAVQFGLNP